MVLNPFCRRWLSTGTWTAIRTTSASQLASRTPPPSSPFLKCACRSALRPSSRRENYYYYTTTRTRLFTTSTRLSSSSPFRLTSSSSQQSNKPDYSSLPETAEEAAEKQHVYYSPYKPKRQWPPDMSKLSHKHQFRLERKFRRRAALKYARPKWVKATKLVQWGLIGCPYNSFFFFFFTVPLRERPFADLS